MLTVRRADCPPDPGPELEVRRVGAGLSMTVMFLCVSIRGFWTHWNPGRNRTQPCLEPVESCPGHKQQLPLRWKAYAHVFDHGNRDQCLLELTPGAARQLQTALGTQKDLRGMRVLIARGKGAKARLSVSIQKIATDQEKAKLPREHDAIVTLSKLWNFSAESPPEFPEADLI